jgi:hypothetical protein
MKRLRSLLWLHTFGLPALLVLSAPACARCFATSDCDEGEHCEFQSGECLPGCDSTTCSKLARCDEQTGQCVLVRDLPHRDASTSSTSSTADAG